MTFCSCDSLLNLICNCWNLLVIPRACVTSEFQLHRLLHLLTQNKLLCASTSASSFQCPELQLHHLLCHSPEPSSTALSPEQTNAFLYNLSPVSVSAFRSRIPTQKSQQLSLLTETQVWSFGSICYYITQVSNRIEVSALSMHLLSHSPTHAPSVSLFLL